MCEFHYDFVNNEPFYFCDNHNCVCSREIEEDFLTIYIGFGERDSISLSKILKLDPDIKIGILISWLSISGDIASPHLFYRGQKLSVERTLRSYEIANFEYVVIRSKWPHHVDISLAPRISFDEDPRSWPEYIDWCKSGFFKSMGIAG
jgi:ribosome-binding factor A